MKAREGFVEVEGHRLAYLAVNEHLARADEPAVVFIHGVLASVNFWRDCVPPAFRDRRAWFALSLPAHHPSTVPPGFHASQVDGEFFYRLVSGALQALVAERKAIVVGHSTGGFCALNLAIHRAPMVTGIVSVAGFHQGNWGSVEGMLLRLAGLGRWTKYLFAATISLARTSGLVQRVFASLLAHDRKAYRANPLSRRMLDNIAPNTRRQDPLALFELFNGISRLDIRQQLGQIAMPCYIIAGSHDPVVRAHQSLAIAGAVPGARLLVFPGVGHMPFIEAADACARALEAAIDEVSRPKREPASS